MINDQLKQKNVAYVLNQHNKNNLWHFPWKKVSQNWSNVGESFFNALKKNVRPISMDFVQKLFFIEQKWVLSNGYWVLSNEPMLLMKFV